MLIDTHCHLNYLHGTDLDKIADVLSFAKRRGVTRFICISVDTVALSEVLLIANHFDQVKATVGVHPCDVKRQPFSQSRSVLEEHVASDQVVAVGEFGLDYYHEEGLDLALQKQVFTEQIELSIAHQKPLVVHTRDARADTIDLLKSVGQGNATGVLHCFTESKEMAKKALDLGFYISFSGIITFKNAHDLQDVVRYVPLSSILVETDSPYLAPVPYRGKQNQPAYVVEVAQQVAQLKGVSFETVCTETTKNAQSLFRWL
jgi:TatD DNase family protein